jgi:hypothetical protein
MVMPLAGRVVAAVIGGVLVIAAAWSIIGTLIVTRSVSSKLTHWVDLWVDRVYQLRVRGVADYRRRDRMFATQAAAILLTQLATWLIVAYVGFALLLWPFAHHGVVSAFIDAGSSLFTLGFAVPSGAAPAVIVFVAAAVGLTILTLQIAYLPTLYAAYNRRETEVALLNSRGGIPSWGPELLARTHYGLGSGTSTLDTMPDLYGQWERWASDVAESHTTYLPLVRFRSPRALSSWVTSLLSVLDSAALFLALSPSAAPVVPARLCLRSGFLCFIRIAQAMGFDIPDEADPEAEISLTYDDFLEAVTRMREVDFPIERDPADAWPEFVGWRVNYERAAYAVAAAVYAVPAKWSGPRRHKTETIAPERPGPGRPPKQVLRGARDSGSPVSSAPDAVRPHHQRQPGRGPQVTANRLPTPPGRHLEQQALGLGQPPATRGPRHQPRCCAQQRPSWRRRGRIPGGVVQSQR